MGARPPMNRPSAAGGGGIVIPPQPEHPAVMDEAVIWLDELGAIWDGNLQLVGWTNRGTGGATYDIASMEDSSITSPVYRTGNDAQSRPALNMADPGSRGYIASPTSIDTNNWEGEAWVVCRYGYNGEQGVQSRGWLMDQHPAQASTDNEHLRLRISHVGLITEPHPRPNINVGKGPGQGASGVNAQQDIDQEWGLWRGNYDRAGSRPSLWVTRPVPQFNSVGGVVMAANYSRICYFGYETANSQNWRGGIAEFLIFDRLLTDQEAADVEDYLDLKWACGQYGFDP